MMPNDKEAWREYHKQQRIERKLDLLKRSALLSYVRNMAQRELLPDMVYASKWELIDWIETSGHSEAILEWYGL